MISLIVLSGGMIFSEAYAESYYADTVLSNTTIPLGSNVVYGGATLYIEGEVNVEGNLEIREGFLSIKKDSTLKILPTGFVEIHENQKTFVNFPGTILIEPDGSFVNRGNYYGNGYTDNYGQFLNVGYLSTDHTFRNFGIINNDGEFTILSNGKLVNRDDATFYNQQDATFVNEGKFYNHNGNPQIQNNGQMSFSGIEQLNEGIIMNFHGLTFSQAFTNNGDILKGCDGFSSGASLIDGKSIIDVCTSSFDVPYAEFNEDDTRYLGENNILFRLFDPITNFKTAYNVSYNLLLSGPSEEIIYEIPFATNSEGGDLFAVDLNSPGLHSLIIRILALDSTEIEPAEFFFEFDVADQHENPNEEEFTPKQSDPEPEKEVVIPDWLRGIAGFWCQDRIDDASFLEAIQFLIHRGIISVPIDSIDSSGSQEIPAWIKHAACGWAADSIPDSDFAEAIVYLIQTRMILI